MYVYVCVCRSNHFVMHAHVCVCADIAFRRKYRAATHR